MRSFAAAAPRHQASRPKDELNDVPIVRLVGPLCTRAQEPPGPQLRTKAAMKAEMPPSPQLRAKAEIATVDMVTATATMITGDLDILMIAIVMPNCR